MTAVHEHPVAIVVSIWPEDHVCMDAVYWSLLVTERKPGEWAVEQGTMQGDLKIVLTRSGEWDDDKRGDPAYRFTREEARELARQHAAAFEVDGLTAEQALNLHDTRGCRG